ncbi:MAG: energy-coupling factor ABC transporter permease [Clostridiales Family XIII bacterium]|jgi:cobalt/nickel transport system permease protein|nr:energy-coupling factor ABC transporter permease [Clostridiales Family XIII bacterium]
MADALLSPGVGGGMYAASVAAIAISAAKIKKDDLGESKVPLMAVSGAMDFAAQMINFTIPATGSSGHIGGGILLAALLGPFAGLLALAAVLVIQCLFFADGGLLALGCNIFNMGVIPCLFIYPLAFRRVLSPSPNAKRIWAGSVVCVVASLQLGAFGVVAETAASGVTELPFSAFILLMQPIHLAIGVVEGLVTAAILNFVYAARPEILTSAAFGTRPQSAAKTRKPASMKKVILAFACVAIVAGAALSLLASPYPDGLEWSMEKVAGTAGLEAGGGVFESFAAAQERLSFMPGYDFAAGAGTGAPVAGIIGAAAVFAAAGAAGLVIRVCKKKRRAAGAAKDA